MASSTSPWLLRDPNPHANHHLLCFGYSGASARLFDRWKIPGVDILPVILPGIGPRRHENTDQALVGLAIDIVYDVLPLLHARYSLLGHSLGAWLSHAVAAVLADQGSRGPDRLFVLSAPPPHVPHRRFTSLHALPDDEFVTELIAQGTEPDSDRHPLRGNPRMVKLVRTYATKAAEYIPGNQAIASPITAIGGVYDSAYPLRDLTSWQDTTRADLSVHVVKAGHFTVTEQPDEVMRIVAQGIHGRPHDLDSIAVIGMSCRFPGADSYTEFWDLLRDGRDAVGPIPPNRRTDPDDPVSNVGGFINNIDMFDAEFFGFTPRHAQQSDPRLRLLLMLTQETIDDAGLTAADLAGHRTGTWIAEMHGDYWDLATPVVPFDMYSLSGGGIKTFLTGQLSHVYDLRGPSVTLDTACAGSLTAVHAACQALRNREVDTAFAGGIQIVLNPDGPIGRATRRVASPQGHCAFASVDADGTVRSEGVGIVLLKRLSDAIRDHDPIHAVIEGTAINSNGQSGHASIVATSGAAQAAAMRQAMTNAGCHPSDISYVEAHGTGTKVGDPVELAALHDVFGANPNPCLIGSVKTNVGHLEPAAGMAGLIKTILALHHRQIPASLFHKAPSPALDWERSALRVATTNTPWPRTHDEPRAAVCSSGLGGANAHAILTTRPSTETPVRDRLPRRTWNLQPYWYTDLLA